MVAQGGRQALLSMYEEFFIALCIFARGFVQERELAEDIVQDVFVRLCDDRRSFENQHLLKAYLYGAVRNGCLNYMRDEKRRRTRESKYMEEMLDTRVVFDQIIENEVYRQLLKLQSELPPMCKNIFERSLEGATSQEIANTLNLSVETVKTHRKNAKRILRGRYALLSKSFWSSSSKK